MELDLGAVRAFVAVAEDRYFGEAAIRLEMSQQAVSKRVAKLEADLGVQLLSRTRGGAEPTENGEAFLKHARALIGLADQAVEQLRGRRRPLRVDVLGTRLATMEVIRAFHADHDVELELVTPGLGAQRRPMLPDSVDAAFARVSTVTDPAISRTPAYLEPANLLVGRRHPLARRRQVAMAELAGLTAWMPYSARASEWAEFWQELCPAFGVLADTDGPNFGLEHHIEVLSTAKDRVGFVGAKTHVPWHPDVVRIPLVDPTPVYPFSLLWRHENKHPTLSLLVEHVQSGYRPFDAERQWLPEADRAAMSI
ncbi:LysR family transcriptional regulator [Amycolatopsis orientalis]|uniref:LysR family transcriptional regulator n=1 Tax=Amycolatopsis orientalis TaxID=31958 RepID=UPI0004034838|nr:LysR family transcriptional regulator [Amycolatopsis orientalis]